MKWFKQSLSTLDGSARRLKNLYHPDTLRARGLYWSVGLFAITVSLLIALLGWYWNTEPEPFDVNQRALVRSGSETKQLVVGYRYVSTLLEIGETLLNKRGGYLSNDLMPPGSLMDNVPNWEFGALVMLRDASAALRNHISRSQSQSLEDPDLARAEPQFNYQNDSWILPATESEYRKGLDALERYLERLADNSKQDAQFFARADNLRQYLEIVGKRLGSFSQRLSASVGQVRINTDMAGEPDAQQSTPAARAITVKTPWLELDDVFYEARGATWALLHILKALEYDFGQILQKKNALVSLRQIVRELQYTQQTTLSPVILNGSGFGLFANYSLVMANYVARANAAVIDLRTLLEKG